MIFMKRLCSVVLLMGVWGMVPMFGMENETVDPEVGEGKAEFFQQVHQFTCQMQGRPQNPYGQVRIVNPDDCIVCMGDIHGDTDTFLDNLNKMQELGLIDPYGKLSPHVTLCFLGDLIDRGEGSVGSLFLALELHEINGDQVVILQGNHETRELQDLYAKAQFTDCFYSQLDQQFGGCSQDERNAVAALFECFPQVFLVGGVCRDKKVNFLQLCHAGLGEYDGGKRKKITVDVQPLFARAFQNYNEVDSFFSFAGEGIDPINGFIWNDVTIFGGENVKRHKKALVMDPIEFKGKLEKQKCSLDGLEFFTSGMVSGHQHPEGVAKLVFRSLLPLANEQTENIENGSLYKLTSNRVVCKRNGFAVLHFNQDKGLWKITSYCDVSNAITPVGGMLSEESRSALPCQTDNIVEANCSGLPSLGLAENAELFYVAQPEEEEESDDFFPSALRQPKKKSE